MLLFLLLIFILALHWLMSILPQDSLVLCFQEVSWLTTQVLPDPLLCPCRLASLLAPTLLSIP
mgnify:FL=1